jgi:nitroreductase
MEVSKAIQLKRAIREFSDNNVPKEDIQLVLNAGRRAQSSKNTQPWNFICVTDPQILDNLSKLGHFAGHIAGANFAIAILTPHPDERFSIMFDAGQAAAYMQLAAWDIGIGSCLATIYESEQARELLGFPSELHIRIAISFGYPKDPALLDRLPRRGGRQGFEEVTHWDRW